jgi:hypothetical protein
MTPPEQLHRNSGEGNESLPLYPYAKRPNGCSIPSGKPGEYDNYGSLGYNFSFREPCNNHDRCYYTLGTTANQCNIKYTEELLRVCHDGASQALKPQDILTGGSSRASAVNNCLARADVISKAVIAAQSKYHLIAQNTQAKYLQEVDSYIANQRKPNPSPIAQVTTSRTRWENGPNSNFTNTSPGKWIENDGRGSSFTETTKNSEYIEIYDASRDFYLRLKDRGFCFKNPGDPNWHCGDGGRWTR